MWEGAVQSGGQPALSDLCIAISEAAEDTFVGRRLAGEVNVDGVSAGIVVGVMDDRGRFTIAGSELVSIYSGTLDGETISGTWGTTGADIAPELRTWSAEKTAREGCA